jgi:multidrug resistance protein
MAEMGSTDSVLGAFIVSIFVLGLATGPLFLSPMSEVYGRLPLYHICNVLFFAFTIGSALCTNVGMVIAFRFLGGCASAAPMSIGGGTIADIIKHKRRGLAMTLFSAGPILGSTIGPVGGGYLVQNLGWRWGFWTLSIIVSLR